MHLLGVSHGVPVVLGLRNRIASCISYSHDNVPVIGVLIQSDGITPPLSIHLQTIFHIIKHIQRITKHLKIKPSSQQESVGHVTPTVKKFLLPTLMLRLPYLCYLGIYLRDAFLFRASVPL